jgi:hypothetical protein
VCETPLHATVLSVKRYPSEEFGVMIHSTGAVITIKDVKIFVTNSLGASHGPASGLMSGSQDTRDIQEGTQLVLNDVGVWNVNTTALHHARVTIGDRVDIGLGGASDDNTRNFTNVNGKYGQSNNNQNSGWKQSYQRFDQGPPRNTNFQNGQLTNHGRGNNGHATNNGWNPNHQRSDDGQFHHKGRNDYSSSNVNDQSRNTNNNDRRNDNASRAEGSSEQLPRQRKHRMSMI